MWYLADSTDMIIPACSPPTGTVEDFTVLSPKGLSKSGLDKGRICYIS